ncbi:MgtC/SapB family protein [Prevotella melaninogenica]|uniref:MgtC/SapB family protein n=1 Tax=Prevotella melaninogenica TaxID=28132 RepID=UPI001BAD08D5|nr:MULTISPECIES: MgtC/SapB family protein [Prevotella]MBF1430767.1 MgtC/SapB family protein [Prevotella melaninogenica]MBF1581878.1 MgtC/SapB family protein [Prevotella sp.]MBF1620387.1 MgtC/SapB family protein [Prevotella sp.]MBW4727992.1 MgtC/SapB family protein [Prevotella melaninogenica]MBW4730530.1 MgtC/SapB family protein [Prevotella melaninogenica]
MNMITYEFVLRLFVAAMLGGVIGLEREYRAKEAGFRTHFLVALGSGLFMILSQFGFNDVLGHYEQVSLDPSRIASQVVTGIGFIGAGTIIFQKHVVRGLTTAAGLWVTSAIGMTAGAGMYVLSIATTVLVLLCLEALYFILQHFGTRNITVTFSTPKEENIQPVLQRLRDKEIIIDSYEMTRKDTSSGHYFVVTMEMKFKRKRYKNHLLNFMAEFENVTVETME